MQATAEQPDERAESRLRSQGSSFGPVAGQTGAGGLDLVAMRVLGAAVRSRRCAGRATGRLHSSVQLPCAPAHLRNLRNHIEVVVEIAERKVQFLQIQIVGEVAEVVAQGRCRRSRMNGSRFGRSLSARSRSRRSGSRARTSRSRSRGRRRRSPVNEWRVTGAEGAKKGRVKINRRPSLTACSPIAPSWTGWRPRPRRCRAPGETVRNRRCTGRATGGLER